MSTDSIVVRGARVHNLKNIYFEVKRDTVDDIAARILQLPEATRLQLLFPVRAALHQPIASDNGAKPKRLSQKAKRAGEEAKAAAISAALKERLFDLRKRGFSRLYQEGKIFEFSTPESLLEINFAQPVFVLVDRLVVSPQPQTPARIVGGVEIAYRESGE